MARSLPEHSPFQSSFVHNHSARNKELILLIAPFELRECLSDFLEGEEGGLCETGASKPCLRQPGTFASFRKDGEQQLAGMGSTLQGHGLHFSNTSLS